MGKLLWLHVQKNYAICNFNDYWIFNEMWKENTLTSLLSPLMLKFCGVPLIAWSTPFTLQKNQSLFNYLQSETKLFQHLRYYLRFFSGLIANFYHLMLVINSVNPNDHNLTNIYFIKQHLIWVFDSNYHKCSDKFAADSSIEFLY